MTLDPEIKKQFKIIRKNQKQTMFWLLIIFVALGALIIFPQPAQAQTITITNSADLSERDINVYYANYTTGQMDMLGRYNTTSVIDIDSNTSYTLDLVPININPMTDPGEWMTEVMFPLISSNLVAIIILIYLVTKRG
jgi:hypothetical protein